MAHVPDQDVLRSLVDVVQRHRELDDAQPGAQVSTRLGDRIDGLSPQFVGQLAKLREGQVTGVGRRGNRIEQGCFWRH